MSPPNSIDTLNYLSAMPRVSGEELQQLSNEFSRSLTEVVTHPESKEQLYNALTHINPHFAPEQYSDNEKANVLANIVAAVYAPLFHGFAETILDNIEAGKLPNIILAPPRDAIPIVTALQAQITERETKGQMSIPVIILQPAVNRITAGISNAQGHLTATQDPLLEEYLLQELSPFKGSAVLEVETGIYGTTSLVTAQVLRKLGITDTYTSVKWYALGPNMSYIHALLNNGAEWIADRTEESDIPGYVSPQWIAHLMLLLDSMEEFGMEKHYQSIPGLTNQTPDGSIQPIVIQESDENVEIARATNAAIAATAKHYDKTTAHDITMNIVTHIEEIASMSKQMHWPIVLTQPIPPMKDPAKTFDAINQAQCFTYPEITL